MRRDALAIALLALVIGVFMAVQLQQPGYTDAYYYFNAGQRLVQGKGLTDAAIWTYIGAPTGLPIPSHLYWMPLASLVSAGGMLIGGSTFHAAQILFLPLYVGLVLVGFGLGAALGKSRRIAWLAGLLTLFSGFFMPYWLNTDTFALYGLVGSLSLITMGLGRKSGNWRWFALSGALAGFAHLTRADGLLLIVVLVIVALWPGLTRRQALIGVMIGIVGYLVVMTPWFIRNLNAVGMLLPVGGFQTAWMRSYDEIVNYPPGADLQQFLAWGLPNIVASRWEAFIQNLETFIAVEGMIAFTPLMLIGFWRRRNNALLSGFWLYALGLHAAMVLVFAFPSWRGALLHSASALLPFWTALGATGLDDVLIWASKRRHWPLKQSRWFFGGALLLWAIFLSVRTFVGKTTGSSDPQIAAKYQQLGVPQDAVVMINDPPALYYFTGMSSVVVPNAPPNEICTVAVRYGVSYVVLEKNGIPPLIEPLWQRTDVPTCLKVMYSDQDTHIYKVKSRDNPDTPLN